MSQEREVLPERRDGVAGIDRLWDSDWVNIVNHDHAYQGWSMDEAIAHAVKLTQEKMAQYAREALRAHARAAVGEGWRPIESAPRDVELLFWIRPKTGEETYHDTSGNPILDRGKPHAKLCKFKCWPSLWTATHWRFPDPPPAAPAPESATGGAE